MLKKKILCALLLLMLLVSAPACVKKIDKDEASTEPFKTQPTALNIAEEDVSAYNIGEDEIKEDKSAEDKVQDTILVVKMNKNTNAAASPVNLRKQSSVQNSLYKYMSNKANQNSVNASARKLNNGNKHNTCVYFASESLRRVGIKMPKSISNTRQFIGYLKANGWKVNYNLSELKPGDLCFTTNDSTGWPSHVYIFMAWTKSGSMDSAYIVDNQAHDYNDNVYHIRNVKKKLKDKDATKFFMYKL
ncbi:hypothetical protein JK636_14110 [Clostridium sp. YIM B02515]|uniref:Uncharacterized protein n=1 Tax=Clostridium rhizosphaerae TaxID=2803861 RepID=A0ABS1TEW9_9CLOT|nr:hypothetical protein [Clostridium rhizosphaerae]MBL4936889.1 hypothetical protein [Clostridium rhizosphaerae]